MPYSTKHKQKTRAKVIESARILFNRHGFQDVTIDAIMLHAGLTRGGFYHHFKSKEELFSVAVSSFLMGRGAQWRADAGVDIAQAGVETVQASYQELLTAMVGLFENNLKEEIDNPREKALSLAALCVGGMVLARTLPDSTLAEEVRAAAHATALAHSF